MRQRLALHARPLATFVDEETISRITEAFRHRKLAADEARRRGVRPMSSEEWEALGEHIAATEAELRDANARGDCAPVHFDYDALQVVIEAGLSVDPFSEVGNQVYRPMLEAWLEVIELIKARHAGTTIKTPERPQPLSSTDVPPKEVKLDTLMAGWRAEKRPGEKTFYTFERHLKRFEEFLKARDRTIAAGTADDVADWKAALLKEGKSLKTVANILAAGKAVMGWAVENRRLAANPFAEIRIPKEKKAAGSKRRGFTEEETVSLLTDARTRTGYRRWVPWLSAFTGARLDELCQLEVCDIREASGVHYIDINADGPGKSLKTISSQRRVPLHPPLIKEGFLDFVASKPKGPLFGEISPDRFGSRGGNATKILGRWVRSDIKIADPRIAPNHSFRHRFKDECRNAGLAKDVHDALTGHAAGDVGATYGAGFDINFLAREVTRIKVPLGLD